MSRIVNIELSLDEPEDDQNVRRHLAKKLSIPEAELGEFRLRRRGIDARGRRVRRVLTYVVGPADELKPAPTTPPLEAQDGRRIIIVGAGPAGLFCAYELARRGIGSVILDRGKKVQPRRRDLALLNREGKVDEDSNYCFGEGGAGTYSDGKLYTRSKKRGDVEDVLQVLAEHGAPPAILVDARPHIGSNKLPKVVTAMRERLESVGVEFRFQARVMRVVKEGGKAIGVGLADGEDVLGDAVVFATGHSARDVYKLLRDVGVRLSQKPFALGVRIEHPQPLINQIQYGKSAGHPTLPAAYYRLASGGVFSFCMCPGGWIVPAATEAGGQVVNGMSLSKRDSPFANSGLVVSVEPDDWEAAGFSGAMGGVDFQDAIERAAFEAGGGKLCAPATLARDFVQGHGSSEVPKTSYRPGLLPTNVADVLDSAGVSLSPRIRDALRAFDRKMRGYLSKEAVLVGVESRTSSPVRVHRDHETLASSELPGLYPCGEGGGYAGGIVSAALDGMRVAAAIDEASSAS